MSRKERVVVTGMSLLTPLGDTLEGNLEALLAGRSAVSRWGSGFDTSNIYSKVGGDLSGYDIEARVRSYEGRIPADTYKRLRRLSSKSPWSTRLTELLAVAAFSDAGAFAASLDLERVAAIVGGHNINQNLLHQNFIQFAEEPDFIDAMLSLTALDTDHAGCVSEVLGLRGPIYSVGGACASGQVALRCAVDELRHHDMDVALVIGAVLDYAPTDLHAMALMGAISYQGFNDAPDRASRPWDTRREGFVPSHGGAVLVVERLSHAQARNARIYAEVLEVESSSDANHLPQPSQAGQTRLMERVLGKLSMPPEQIDFVSAHATSTPLGDLSEIRAIKSAFGDHARKLKINAAKSMLGHTCWSAPVVEAVVAILQMRAGWLHPSINIDELEPEVADLDVCRGGAVACQVRTLMKNSFGFGGINAVSVLRRFDGREAAQ